MAKLTKEQLEAKTPQELIILRREQHELIKAKNVVLQEELVYGRLIQEVLETK